MPWPTSTKVGAPYLAFVSRGLASAAALESPHFDARLVDFTCAHSVVDSKSMREQRFEPTSKKQDSGEAKCQN